MFTASSGTQQMLVTLPENLNITIMNQLTCLSLRNSHTLLHAASPRPVLQLTLHSCEMEGQKITAAIWDPSTVIPTLPVEMEQSLIFTLIHLLMRLVASYKDFFAEV